MFVKLILMLLAVLSLHMSYCKISFLYSVYNREMDIYNRNIKFFREKVKKIMKKIKKCSIIWVTWECQGFDRVKRLLSAGKREL